MSHVRLALALVLTSMFVFGQSERGNISGIISDPQGAAVAGAVIKVINRRHQRNRECRCVEFRRVQRAES